MISSIALLYKKSANQNDEKIKKNKRGVGIKAIHYTATKSKE